MKKIILSMAAVVVAACSTPPQQSTVPMDMQAVQEYRHRVTTGRTVDPKARPDDQELNQSDKRSKSTVQQPQLRHPVIYPTIGIGYGYHRHRHHPWW